MEHSSSVLSPLAVFDKVTTPDLADFLIQQVHKQMLPPPAQGAWPSGGREGRCRSAHYMYRLVRSELAILCPRPSGTSFTLAMGLEALSECLPT